MARQVIMRPVPPASAGLPAIVGVLQQNFTDLRHVLEGNLAIGGLALNKGLTLSLGTITANAFLLDLSATWNNAAVTFSAFRLNITDTASAAASKLLDLQVGGVSKFNVDKAGLVTVPGDASSQVLQSGNALVSRLGSGTWVLFSNLRNDNTLFDTALPGWLLRVDSASDMLRVSRRPSGAGAIVPTPLVNVGASAFDTTFRVGPSGTVASIEAFRVVDDIVTPTNFERIRMASDIVASTVGFASEAGGTGVLRPMVFFVGATEAFRLTTGQIGQFANAIQIGTNPAALGTIRLANAAEIRGRNLANTADVILAVVNGADEVSLAPGGADIRWGKALVALGGGAAPTFGTIGGSGPATAAQNSWMRVIDSGGDPAWLAVWK